MTTTLRDLQILVGILAGLSLAWTRFSDPASRGWEGARRAGWLSGILRRPSNGDGDLKDFGGGVLREQLFFAMTGARTSPVVRKALMDAFKTETLTTVHLKAAAAYLSPARPSRKTLHGEQSQSGRPDNEQKGKAVPSPDIQWARHRLRFDMSLFIGMFFVVTMVGLGYVAFALYEMFRTSEPLVSGNAASPSVLGPWWVPLGILAAWAMEYAICVPLARKAIRASLVKRTLECTR